MKAGDPIWILNNKNEITTSTISKLGRKYGYFSFYGWDKKCFLLDSMSVVTSFSNYDGKVFLSEQAVNEHIQKEELAREITRRIYSSALNADDYSLDCLVQIKTLLDLKTCPF